jgi:hypothetical protein
MNLIHIIVLEAIECLSSMPYQVKVNESKWLTVTTQKKKKKETTRRVCLKRQFGCQKALPNLYKLLLRLIEGRSGG